MFNKMEPSAVVKWAGVGLLLASPGVAKAVEAVLPARPGPVPVASGTQDAAVESASVSPAAGPTRVPANFSFRSATRDMSGRLLELEIQYPGEVRRFRRVEGNEWIRETGGKTDTWIAEIEFNNNEVRYRPADGKHVNGTGAWKVFVLSTLSTQPVAAPAVEPGAKRANSLLDLVVTQPNGRTSLRDLAAKESRPIIVHIGASWCPGCVQELPKLKAHANMEGWQLLNLAIDEHPNESGLVNLNVAGTDMSQFNSGPIPQNYLIVNGEWKPVASPRGDAFISDVKQIVEGLRGQ